MSLFVRTALNVPKQIFIPWDKGIKREFSAYISTPYTHPHKQIACGQTYYSCQEPLSLGFVFSDLALGHLPCCSTAEMPTSQKRTNFSCDINQLWNDLKFVKSLPCYRALRKLVFRWSLQPHSQACSRAVPSIPLYVVRGNFSVLNVKSLHNCKTQPIVYKNEPLTSDS